MHYLINLLSSSVIVIQVVSSSNMPSGVALTSVTENSSLASLATESSMMEIGTHMIPDDSSLGAKVSRNVALV